MESTSEANFAAFKQGCTSLLMECSQLASLTEGEWAAISLDQIEVVISRLQDCCISFSLLVQNLTEGSEGHAQCTVLNDSFHHIHHFFLTKWEGAMHREGENDASYQAEVAISGQRGRPSIILSPSQILFLREKHFRWIDIAKLLGISSRTLRRKVVEMGIDDSNFSAISDDELKKCNEVYPRNNTQHWTEPHDGSSQKQRNLCAEMEST